MLKPHANSRTTHTHTHSHVELNRLTITYQSPRVARSHLCWWTRAGCSRPPTWLRDALRGEAALSAESCWVRTRGGGRSRSNPDGTERGDTSPSSRIPQRSCHSQSLTPAERPRLPHSCRANVDPPGGHVERGPRELRKPLQEIATDVSLRLTRSREKQR